MDRRLFATLTAIITLAGAAGCSPYRPALDASRHATPPKVAGYSPPASVTTPPLGGVVTPPLSITATVPLAVQATPAPAAATPPAEIQDVAFATARDGWLVSSGVQGTSPTGGDGAIYRTTDGGATWTQVWRGGESSLIRIGVLGTPGHLYAAGTAFSQRHPGGTPLWLTSADGGAAWTAMQPALPPPAHPTPPSMPPPVWPSLQFDFVTPQVGFASPDPEDAAGAGIPGVIWRTGDGGRSWQILPLPHGLVASGGLDFLNPQDGWITGGAPGTCDQLWHTTDGGQTWRPAPGTCPDFGLQAVYFTDGDHGFAAGGVIPFIGAQAGILATGDGGATWRTVYHTQGTASTGPITHLTFSTPAQGWAWGGTCKIGQNGPCVGRVLVTHDGGGSWTLTKQSALRLTAVGPQAWTTEGPPAGPAPAIGHTADGGSRWTEASQPAAYAICCLRPAPGRPAAVQLVQLTAPDGLAGAAFTHSPGMTGWIPAPADPFTNEEGSSVWRPWSNVIFRSGRDGFQVSGDGGQTWQASPLPPGSFNVSDVAFTSALDGWAVTQQVCPAAAPSPITCAALDRTRDGGRTWTTAAHLPIDGLGAVLAFAQQLGVVVGSGSGTSVAITTDGGAAWTVSALPEGFQCGAPAISGMAIWLPCQTAAYGGVLLHSSDGGAVWTAATSRTVVPTAIAMTGATHGWMLAAGEGPTALSLFRTTDAGAHWTQTWPSLPRG